MKSIKVIFVSILLFAYGALPAADRGQGTSVTVTGFVLDSACAFIKNLTKPVSPDCAVSCAKAGSPLVILGDDGTIYWPIADTMPATGQNGKLLPLAGQKVSARGTVYVRGGSHAIVIEKLEPLSEAK